MTVFELLRQAGDLIFFTQSELVILGCAGWWHHGLCGSWPFSVLNCLLSSLQLSVGV